MIINEFWIKTYSYFRSERSIDRNIFLVHEVLGTARWVLKPAAKDNKTYGAIIPKNDQQIIQTVSKKNSQNSSFKKNPDILGYEIVW